MCPNNVYKFLLSIFICQIFIRETLSCGHVLTNISEIVTGVNIAPLPVGYQPRSLSANSIRIFFEYMDSFNSYPGASDIKANIMEPARLRLQSMLTVNNPISGVLRVDRQCISGTYNVGSNNDYGCATGCTTTTCLGVTVPDKYLNKCKIMSSSGVVSYTDADGSGVPNVDIVLLVVSTTCPTSVLASANSCFQESQLDRPILGVINICPGMITANTNNKVNTITITHEIIHALGFSADKFAFYRSADGTPLVPRNNFGRPVTGINGYGFYIWNEKVVMLVTRFRASVTSSYTKQFYALVLPNIVAVARDHFNCPTITAVELEDYGTIGSALSHFDEYVLYNEYMTAESNGWNQRLSKFTLALLKDTGWYGVDYSMADDMDYGKNAGCTLPLNGCYTYMLQQRISNNPIDPFCDVANGQILQCHSSRQYYQYCNIRRYSSVDSQLQYFTSVKGTSLYSPNFYAGASPYSEYCPMKSVPPIDGFTSNCSDTNNNGQSNTYTPISSNYGPNAICFDTSLNNQPTYGATCLDYNYDGTSNSYTLCIENQGVLCSNNAVQPFTLSSATSGNISCINPSSLKQSSPVKTCQPKKEGNNLQSHLWIVMWITFFGIFIQLNDHA